MKHLKKPEEYIDRNAENVTMKMKKLVRILKVIEIINGNSTKTFINLDKIFLKQEKKLFQKFFMKIKQKEAGKLQKLKSFVKLCQQLS